MTKDDVILLRTLTREHSAQLLVAARADPFGGPCHGLVKVRFGAVHATDRFDDRESGYPCRRICNFLISTGGQKEGDPDYRKQLFQRILTF